jgi:hypothetical protein
MQWWCNKIKFNWSNQIIRSSDLLIFLEKINLSNNSRFAISSIHLINSTYHSIASSIFQHILSVWHLDAQTDRFFWLIRWVMSIRWSCFENSSCFCRDNILMKSSADISAVEHQFTLIRFVWISYLNQCLWISTYFSFVSSFSISFFNTRRIWRLSQRICNFFIESNRMNSKNNHHQIVFFAIRLRINNSVSMLNVIIVICLIVRQSMKSS